jgi:hypothetical protein
MSYGYELWFRAMVMSSGFELWFRALVPSSGYELCLGSQAWCAWNQAWVRSEARGTDCFPLILSPVPIRDPS